MHRLRSPRSTRSLLLHNQGVARLVAATPPSSLFVRPNPTFSAAAEPACRHVSSHAAAARPLALPLRAASRPSIVAPRNAHNPHLVHRACLHTLRSVASENLPTTAISASTASSAQAQSSLLRTAVRVTAYGTFAAAGVGFYMAFSLVEFPEDMPFYERIWAVVVGFGRFLRAVSVSVSIASDYKLLDAEKDSMTPDEYKAERHAVHQRSAEKLLNAFKLAGGIYIKAGQHVASLDHLLPVEYVRTMAFLQDHAPFRPWEEIREAFKDEIGAYPEDVFERIDTQPIAAASLAQVHRAVTKDGKEVAVKIQYPGLVTTCQGDVYTIDLMVRTAGYLFPMFNLQWLVDEFKENLPHELNFRQEATNAERTARLFRDNPDVHVPAIHWDLTTSKVLTMEFVHGVKINDVQRLQERNLDPTRVVNTLADIFSTQIFIHGWVHCDPHPGNLLVRRNPRTGQPQIIVLDHGLYRQLDDEFRLDYARLWRSIVFGDLRKLRKYCRRLGSGDLYELMSVMLTQRSWQSIQKGLGNSGLTTAQEAQELKAGAQEFLVQIGEVLERVPRQMLLLLKTNDLLRSINRDLSADINPVRSIAIKSTEAVCISRSNVRHPVLSSINAARDYAVVYSLLAAMDLHKWMSGSSPADVDIVAEAEQLAAMEIDAADDDQDDNKNAASKSNENKV